MVQLGFVGQFPANYGDNAQRLSLQKQGNFSPDTVDFTAALIQGKHVGKKFMATTPSIESMLSAIKSNPNASISRIDLLTHASPGYVGLRGKVEVAKTTGGYTHRVLFDPDTSGKFLASSDLSRPALEEAAKDDQAKEAFAVARQKFAKDAQFHVYACNAGLAPSAATPLAQLVADAFGVQTFMFLAEMGFHLRENSKWGFHLRYVISGRDPATGLPNMKTTDEVDDYRGLDQMTPLIVSKSPAAKGK